MARVAQDDVQTGVDGAAGDAGADHTGADDAEGRDAHFWFSVRTHSPAAAPAGGTAPGARFHPSRADQYEQGSPAPRTDHIV
ncbi:hypothetical protein GCM10018772_15580 [Streptomyces fumanus]|uniref:Uncharacterized protein n=1 Tax=Streptomyces fumanus TaxID=67302 RepID=A0A919A8T9_9ACTN|nr:hypothetical protein GCM10018772_15580 [Streptomyces fumanus]